MPPPRVYKTAAVVLRHRKLGESDKIITLYSPHLGKIDCVAKGVRKAKSRMAGHVEPLTQATFLLARGRTLDIVTQVETIESFQPIRGDLDRLACALYACELLDRFTEPHAANAGLYGLLLDTLHRIEKRDDAALTLRYYEMALLDEMGYRPELEECIACRARLEPVTNYWTAAGGGVACSACRRAESAVRTISPNAIKLLRLLLHGRWPDVARVNIDAALAVEMERALSEYLRWVLERDIRSAAFIDEVRRRPRVRAAAFRA
jgi:DNA repair protein RecO (recombination protein O)